MEVWLYSIITIVALKNLIYNVHIKKTVFYGKILFHFGHLLY